MLNTSSIILNGNESFNDAFKLLPENTGAKIRYLYAEDETGSKVNTGCYQISINAGEKWDSPRRCKLNKDGQLVPVNIDTRSKLANASIFYDTFTKPTHAGSNATQSWLVGDIDKCNILGDDYDIQGMIISTIHEPLPRYYISFMRIVCENQFSTLGKNNASMYINMNEFLQQDYTLEAKEKLQSLISAEVEKRIKESDRIYNKLAHTHLSDAQIQDMFERLTINTVAKENEERYHQEELRLDNYLKVYNSDDNQNFKQSLFGFVNACTNVNTRERTSPLDVLKPVLPAQVIDSPFNFEYCVRSALINNSGVA